MPRKGTSQKQNTTRSGVIIDNGTSNADSYDDGDYDKTKKRQHQRDEEELEEWMDNARSPATGDDEKRASRSGNEPSSERPSKKKKVPSIKTPKNSVEMNLPGVDGNDNIENSFGSRQSSGRVVRYASKLGNKAAARDGQDFASPSDLSRVSTLPPTPFEHTTQEDDEEDQVEDGTEQGAADDVEEALVDNDGEGFDVEAVAKSSADAQVHGSDRSLNPESPRDDFPTTADYDDDDYVDYRNGGDDLGPPTHQDDTTDDENSRLNTSEENEGSGEGINGLDSDHEDGEDFGEEDKEGPSFNMVHDPETPHSVRRQRAQREREGILQARKEDDAGTGDDKDEDDESNDLSEMKRSKTKETKKRKKKTKKVTMQRRGPFSPKGIPGPRTYEQIPYHNLPSPDPEGPRRSKRMKIPPLHFWKNERFAYGANDNPEEMGDMPVVKTIQKAEDTPYKKRKGTNNSNNAGRKKNKVGKRAPDQDEVEEFDTRKLQKKYSIIDGTDAMVWDDQLDQAESTNVVEYASSLTLTTLQPPKNRTKSEGNVVGKASQAFISQTGGVYPGYLMGNLLLPPHGIKDPESVGACAQTFTVVSCQPKAVEVAFADPDEPDGELDEKTAQRFLLSPGDIFRIPPGNCYRLCNHSETVDAKFTWTIIRAMELEADD